MFCTQCGFRKPPDALFCPACGKLLSSKEHLSELNYGSQEVTARSLFSTYHPMPLRKAIDLIKAVCEELLRFHHSGRTYGRLKPEFIILKNNQVRLVQVGHESGPITASIRNDVPYYLSPEQCLGQSVDTRSDIYSLGVVLFEMLTGRLPVEGSVQNVVQFHVAQKVVSARNYLSSLPAPIEQFLNELLQPDMNKRPQTIGQVLAKLILIQRTLLDNEDFEPTVNDEFEALVSNDDLTTNNEEAAKEPSTNDLITNNDGIDSAELPSDHAKAYIFDQNGLEDSYSAAKKFDQKNSFNEVFEKSDPDSMSTFKEVPPAPVPVPPPSYLDPDIVTENDLEVISETPAAAPAEKDLGKETNNLSEPDLAERPMTETLSESKFPLFSKNTLRNLRSAAATFSEKHSKSGINPFTLLFIAIFILVVLAIILSVLSS
ncbi:MAG: protein kinase [Blastocatellia bacterium]|nr:protein kinase [Blastocatellia bacterium]